MTLLIILISLLATLQVFMVFYISKLQKQYFILNKELSKFKAISSERTKDIKCLNELHQEEMREIIMKFYGSNSIDEFYREVIVDLELKYGESDLINME